MDLMLKWNQQITLLMFACQDQNSLNNVRMDGLSILTLKHKTIMHKVNSNVKIKQNDVMTATYTITSQMDKT